MADTDPSSPTQLDALQRDHRYDAVNKAIARGALTYSELRAISEDDLIFYHDVLVAQTKARVGIDYYLNELARRDYDDLNNELLAYTKRVTDMSRVMTWLTVVITILTVISLATTIIAVLR